MKDTWQIMIQEQIEMYWLIFIISVLYVLICVWTFWECLRNVLLSMGLLMEEIIGNAWGLLWFLMKWILIKYCWFLVEQALLVFWGKSWDKANSLFIELFSFASLNIYNLIILCSWIHFKVQSHSENFYKPKI